MYLVVVMKPTAIFWNSGSLAPNMSTPMISNAPRQMTSTTCECVWMFCCGYQLSAVDARSTLTIIQTHGPYTVSSALWGTKLTANCAMFCEHRINVSVSCEMLGFTVGNPWNAQNHISILVVCTNAGPLNVSSHSPTKTTYAQARALVRTQIGTSKTHCGGSSRCVRDKIRCWRRSNWNTALQCNQVNRRTSFYAGLWSVKSLGLGPTSWIRMPVCLCTEVCPRVRPYVRGRAVHPGTPAFLYVNVEQY